MTSNESADMRSAMDQAIGQENYLEALRLVRVMLRKEPFEKDLVQKMSYILRMIGFTALAILYENFLMKPDDSATLYELGVNLFEQGDYHLSVPYLERSFRLSPKNSSAALQCGIAYLKCQEVSNAINKFIQYEELATNIGFPTETGTGWRFYAELLRGNRAVVDVVKLEYGDCFEDLALIADRLQGSAEELTARDRHFIQYGKALLRTYGSELNVPETVDTVGKFAYIPIGLPEVANILAILQTMLGTLQPLQGTSGVMGISPTASILAKVLSRQAQIPIVKIEEFREFIERSRVLVIGIDSHEFVDLLQEHQIPYRLPFAEDYTDITGIGKNLLTFSLTHNWTKDRMFLPDIVGYLTQTSRHDWYIENDPQETVNQIIDYYPNVDVNYQQMVWGFYKNRELLLDFNRKSAFDLCSSLKVNQFWV